MKQNLQNLSNALKNLALDTITNANSGHPGICLGLADIITILYKNFIVFNPNDSCWKFRDYLIWSAGHGSTAVYSSLFLTGYKLNIEDLKNFRKLHSKTPGHPEYRVTDGVEVTTGPLGQGVANSVGIAMGYKILSLKFEKLQQDGKIKKEIENPFKKVKVYCIVGDGCLMEGISQEAISFAARYNLTNLVLIFDNNSITIDGKTDISTIENHSKRFSALNFEVLEIDGHVENEIIDAFEKVKDNPNKMHFISAKTLIGNGSISEGTPKAHGTPLTEEELLKFKEKTNYSKEKFDVPAELLQEWRNFYLRNANFYHETKDIEKEIFNHFGEFFKDEILFENLENIYNTLNDFKEKTILNRSEVSTRKFSQKTLEFFNNSTACIFGTADLTESVCFNFKNSKNINENSFGNFISYGIREHAMGSIMNGLSLCNFIPFGGTFLCFSDYLRPAMRLSALMKLKVMYIFSHDSIFLGEDGPTHQAIEHFSSLNLIPNLTIFRPCDEIETIECYQNSIIELKNLRPCVMILSRQNIKLFDRKNLETNKNFSSFGAYEIFFFKGKKLEQNSNKIKKLIIIANGSEVSLVMKTIEYNLKNLGQMDFFDIKIISMPSLNLFERQSKQYQEEILEFSNQEAKRIFVFAGNGDIFRKFFRDYEDILIDIKTFGESAPYNQILNHFHFDEKSLHQKLLNF